VKNFHVHTLGMGFFFLNRRDSGTLSAEALHGNEYSLPLRVPGNSQIPQVFLSGSATVAGAGASHHFAVGLDTL